MNGLTKRQREIVDFIDEFIGQNNYSPSYREIMNHFGFSSLGSVYKHIAVLKRKGVIKAQKNSARSISIEEVDNSSHTVELPFLGYIAAGTPIQTFPQSETMLVPKHLVVKPEKSYVLQVRGDSMIDDQIADRDYIVVEARSFASPGETVVALVKRQETTLKRYFPDGADHIRLEPANRHFKPIVLHRSEIEIQGVLRALVRNYQGESR